MTRQTAELALAEAGIGSASRSLVLEASEAAREAFENAARGIQARLAQPLRDLAAAAARRHGDLAQEGKAPLRVPAYRMAVAEQVLGPLAEQLSHLPFDLAMDAIIRIPETLAPLAEHAEETVAAALLPADAAPDNAAAGAGRALGRPRPARRRKGNGKEAHRYVPLRALLRYHLHVRVARSAETLHRGAEEHMAALAGHLELALAGWSDRVLRIEHDLEGGRAPELPLAADPAPAAGADPDRPEEVSAMIGGLQQALEHVAAQAMPPWDSAASLDQDLLQLGEDLRKAGTALLKDADRRLPEEAARHRMQQVRRRWASWHVQAQARIDLVLRLVRLRQTVLEARAAMLDKVKRTALAPVLQTFEDAATLLADASRSCTTEEPQRLPAALLHVESAVLEPVRQSLTELCGAQEADQVLALPGHEAWQAVTRQVQTWPEAFVMHGMPEPDAGAALPSGTRRRHIRRDVLEVLAPFPERLVPGAGPLRRRLADVRGATDQAIGVAEFSLAAARKELEGGTAGEHADNARQLAGGGLLRAADAFRDLVQSLQAPWQQFAQAVHELFHGDWADLHRSVSAEPSIERRWLGLRNRLRLMRRRTGQRLRAHAERTRSALARILRRGRRRATELIEQGRTAIGVTGAAESERLATQEALSPRTLGVLQERLPLVYRRLFALEPVTEPWLLEGRSDDLVYLRGHVRRCRNGLAAGALLLPMKAGSGRSSLLRVLQGELEATVPTCMVALRRRMRDADEFAGVVAAALGLRAESLNELEGHLLKARFAVCLLDNAELLMLRTYGGTDLLERVLLFFARTADRVCWIATISDLAWQYLERVLGSAASLVSTYRPATASRTMLGSIMLNRHSRSGLRLEFAPPAAATTLFSGKLERARSDEARQVLLRDHYFEQLHQQCGSNIMLALVTWLRSAAFGGEGVTLHVRQPLSFRFLQSLELTRAFTLKAFLIHNTLTPAEHKTVFHLSRGESTSMLQSLLKLGLIVACQPETAAADAAPDRIEDGTRYRLHPLVVHPVEAWLRGQNIIH